MYTTLADHLKQRNDERTEKYNHELINEWPRITDITSRVYLGMFAWTLPNDKRRLLWEPTHVNLGYGPATPGDIVRDYLGYKFPKRLRVTTQQYHEIMKHRSFPCMAIAGDYPDMTYVDLKSAYWSIMCAVGWDVDYNPGKWMGVRSSVLDFPLPDNKPARSALVTAGLSSPVRVWDGHRLGWQSTNNMHINYSLWALVQDVLHGVAHDMLDVGAVYVHTDGYIVPSGRVGEAMEVIESWGLRSGIKAAGPAHIWGVGVYRVGDHKTKRQHALPFKDHVNVNAIEKDWLRMKFRKFAENKTRYAPMWLTDSEGKTKLSL